MEKELSYLIQDFSYVFKQRIVIFYKIEISKQYKLKNCLKMQENILCK